ncbi:hypothetical protein JTB14_012888 [Gonioctena quinquepunctata]|nr:hypothetical protein JTB14_012888 [Gonioctena quinquepunctata]
MNQLDPIEGDTSQAESSNQNIQEEQEDPSNVDDNFAEGGRIHKGRYVLVNEDIRFHIDPQYSITCHSDCAIQTVNAQIEIGYAPEQ